MHNARHDAAFGSRAAQFALVVAAFAGLIHGLFSAYWAAGGNWLVSTLGHQLVDSFAGRRWLLVPVAAIKVGSAILPLVLARGGWLGGRPWRILCWAGAAVLMVWGGVNTLTANLVLGGVLDHGAGYDRDGMVGHAWLWDPLFFTWGVSLAAALLFARRRRG